MVRHWLLNIGQGNNLTLYSHDIWEFNLNIVNSIYIQKTNSGVYRVIILLIIIHKYYRYIWNKKNCFIHIRNYVFWTFDVAIRKFTLVVPLSWFNRFIFTNQSSFVIWLEIFCVRFQNLIAVFFFCCSLLRRFIAILYEMVTHILNSNSIWK